MNAPTAIYTTPKLRSHRQWERKLSNQQVDPTLFAVVYFFEVYPRKSWGSALPIPVRIWETPRVVSKYRPTNKMTTYSTCAIMNGVELTRFMKNTNMCAGTAQPSDAVDKTNRFAENHRITPMFQRLLHSHDEKIKVVELAGDSTNYGVVSSQYAFAVPFGLPLLNESEREELFIKAYQGLSPKV